jgi:nucleotide-binding universal stress UspA family protein
MSKEFLVCLEGSAGTDEAVRVAIELGRAQNAALVGLAIVDEPDIRAGAATSIGGSSFKHERDEALVADARKHAEEWLARFAERCQVAGVEARTLELVGRPAAQILTVMQAHNLTVMARSANFRFETEDSDPETRDTILHRARHPVLLVPEAAAEQPAAAGGGPVLIAFDGSSASKRAIQSFAESGLHAGRELHLASVDDDGATAWDIANRGVELAKTLGIAAKLHNIVSPLPIADAILELRRNLGATMLVMGAYASLRIKALIWGSVTRELIEKTEVPLYLHH